MSPRIVGSTRGSQSEEPPKRDTATQAAQPEEDAPYEDEGDPQTDVGWFGGDDEEDNKPTVVVRAGAELEALWEEFASKNEVRQEKAGKPTPECTHDPITISRSGNPSESWTDFPEDAWLGVAAACLGLRLRIE